MRINFAKFDSLFTLTRYFNTEKKCRDAIAQARKDVKKVA